MRSQDNRTALHQGIGLVDAARINRSNVVVPNVTLVSAVSRVVARVIVRCVATGCSEIAVSPVPTAVITMIGLGAFCSCANEKECNSQTCCNKELPHFYTFGLKEPQSAHQYRSADTCRLSLSLSKSVPKHFFPKFCVIFRVFLKLAGLKAI